LARAKYDTVSDLKSDNFVHFGIRHRDGFGIGKVPNFGSLSLPVSEHPEEAREAVSERAPAASLLDADPGVLTRQARPRSASAMKCPGENRCS
jgi:hypothetical protein